MRVDVSASALGFNSYIVPMGIESESITASVRGLHDIAAVQNSRTPSSVIHIISVVKTSFLAFPTLPKRLKLKAILLPLRLHLPPH